MISLAGCGGGVCTGWSAIRPAKSDQLAPKTERQILTHNNYGERLGCDGFRANSSSKLPGFSPAFKLPGS